MAEITLLDGGGDDEAPYWSHDFDVSGTDPNLPPFDLSAAEISTTVDVFHRENQVNLLMNLFHQRVDRSKSPYPNFQLDLDLGLGFCSESYGLGSDDCDDVEGYGCGFISADCGDEFSGIDLNLAPRRDIVISDSDGEIEAVNIDLGPFFEENENVGGDDSGVQIFWDSFQLENQRDGGEDFEWEEIDGRVDELEVLSMFLDADVDNDLDLSFSLEDELGTDHITEQELGIDQVRNLEWEVLLNMHNVDSNAEDGYEMLVGQFAGTEAQKPPASKAVVEGLAVVVVTKDDVDNDDLLCAVCKDDMGIGEKAKILPCLHKYHGGCIDPWLGMRNTCPVCRFELPTDDPEYEWRRVERERNGGGHSEV